MMKQNMAIIDRLFCIWKTLSYLWIKIRNSSQFKAVISVLCWIGVLR